MYLDDHPRQSISTCRSLGTTKARRLIARSLLQSHLREQCFAILSPKRLTMERAKSLWWCPLIINYAVDFNIFRAFFNILSFFACSMLQAILGICFFKPEGGFMQRKSIRRSLWKGAQFPALCPPYPISENVILNLMCLTIQ